MLSKLKYLPLLVLIAFVALHKPASPPAAHTQPPQSRLRPLAWQPASSPVAGFTAPLADSDTAGAFTVSLAFDTQGGAAINPGSLQVRASRAVSIEGVSWPAGENLADAPGFMASLNASGANADVSQTTPGTRFDNGEYVLYARITNQAGRASPWSSCRFFVEGASPAVVKASTPIKHGDENVEVVVTGQNLESVTEADFGPGITVHSIAAANSSVTCTLSVAEDAAAGPRVVTLGGGIASFVALPQAVGIVNITYPSERLPQLGAGEARRNAAMAGEGVVLKNGAFTRAESDLTIAGVGLNLEWRRVYRSDLDFDGPMGRNWQAWYLQRVVFDGGLKWHTGEGRIEAFSAVAGGFVAPAGLYYRAHRAPGGEVTLTERHGQRLLFDRQGKLAFIVDINGNHIECEYNHLGQLSRIIDSRGERVRLAYGADGRVASLRDRAWSDATPRTLKYHYNAQGELARFQLPETTHFHDATRLTREYTYDAQHRLTRIVNPRERAHAGLPFLEVEYAAGKVVAQRKGGSGTWSFFRYPANKSRRVLDPRGLRTDYELNSNGAALTITRHTGIWAVDNGTPIDHTLVVQIAPKLRSSDPAQFIDEYAYGMTGEVSRHTLPRGNKVKYEYPIPAQLENGTAGTIATFEITDNSKSWTHNQFAGRWLRVGTDASDYRYYVIVSNTSVSLTLGGFEDMAADGFTSGAPYAVFTANPDPLASGNCLSITRQDGPIGNLADVVTSTSYEPRFQFVKTCIDARGFTTVLTYGYEVSGAGDANECNLVSVQSPTVNLGQPVAQTRITSYEYDERGRAVSTTDAAGVQTIYEYFAAGDAAEYLHSVVRDPGGLNITYEFARNSVGQATACWPPRAHEVGADKDTHKLSCEFNELGQVTHATGPALFESGTARTDEYFIFDENGCLTGHLQEYVTAAGVEPPPPSDPYDPAAYTRATAPMEATWIENSFGYNVQNLPISHTQDLQAGSVVARATWTLSYDAGCNPATLTSAEHRVAQRVYDERNLPFTLTLSPDSTLEGQWRTDYDANGNAMRTLDARGFSWLTEHDGFERPVRFTDPLGHFTLVGFDAAGNAVSRGQFDSGGALLAREDRDFDEGNRIYRVRELARDHNGANIGIGERSTNLLLDSLGRPASVTDDSGRVTQYRFDHAGRTSLLIDAALNELAWGYDAAGGVISRTQRDYDPNTGNYIESSAYADLDRMGNVLRLRDRRYSATLNTESAFAYDGLSQRIAARQGGHQNAIEYRYDLRGLCLGATCKPTADLATWIVTAQGFDADGLLISRSVLDDPSSVSSVAHITHFTRDARGRHAGTTLPGGAAWSLAYDACDNLASCNDPTGTLALFSHDARGLCTRASITRGSGVLGPTQQDWSFDALGRLTQASTSEDGRPLSTEVFAYNTLSCCETTMQSLWRYDGVSLGSFTSAREFDVSGFCSATVFANGRRVSYTPDNLNRVHSISEGTTLATWGYVGPRITEINWGNGTQSRFEYDAELLKSVTLRRGSAMLFATEARYDAASNLQAERFAHEGNRGSVFRHDDTPRASDHLITPVTPVGWHPFDDFTQPIKPVGWHPFDDFTQPIKPVGWHPFDDFTQPIKPVGWHPFDDFTQPIKPVGWHPFDDFNQPIKPVGWHPFDDFGLPQTPRLASSFSGVDLADDAAFDQIPQQFSITRDFTLDTRSSRIATRDRDDAGTSVHETTYTTDADNRYTSVNAHALEYDAAGRIVFDAATGLHYAYDWQGRVVAMDLQADFAQPEKRRSFDARGRLVLEEYFHNSGGYTRYATRALLYDDREFANTELALDNAGTSFASTQQIAGPAPATWRGIAPESSLESHGRAALREVIVHELAGYAAQSQQRFRCEDVQGRLMGVCDQNGRRLSEIGYTEFGAPLLRNVLFDGGDRVQAVAADTPLPGQTTILLEAADLSPSALTGAEICLALPDVANDRYRTATVLSNGAASIVVTDPLGRIFSGLQGHGFVVFDFREAAFAGTGGNWSADGVFASGETAFTQLGQGFLAASGWLLAPNAERGGVLPVHSADGSTLTIEGNANGLAHSGDRYRLYAPVGVSPKTAAMELNPLQEGTRCFYGTTRYEGPLAGFFDGLVVQDAQPGSARQGGYLLWGRLFDVNWGRFREPGAGWPNQYER